MDQFETESCRYALEKRNLGLKSIFEGNEKALSDILNVSTPPGYTFHGIKHIAMVEQYVGRLLGEKRMAKLTDEELFILLMGVLCHDVGMTKYFTDGENYIPDRGNHNIASYLMIYDKPNNKRGCLEINVPSQDPKFFKAIALLCLGHRDHKDKNGHNTNTLLSHCRIEDYDVNISDKFYMTTNFEIHVQYLAAILRLADEIDVTNQRAPRDVEMHLRSFITNVAKEHWCTHQLIDHVEIDSKTNSNITTIRLVPNIDEIKARSSDPVDGLAQDMLLSLIFERLEKIRDEISVINDITTAPSYFSTGLSVKYEIDISFDDDVVTKEKYDDYRKKVSEEKEKKKKEEETGADFEENREIAQVPEETPKDLFNKEIQRLKVDKNLLEIGNFKFPFGEYSHYFINTQLLLTNRNTLNAITDIFKEHYSTIDIDCIIGIGKAGIILAPNLSLKLNTNSSYLIGKWEANSSVIWEKSTSVIEKAKNVLVLLDVISTGIVTRDGIEEIKKNDALLENIYIGTIFCTDNTIKEKLEKEDNVKAFFSINDDFRFKTYSQEEFQGNIKLKEEFELLPLRKK